MDLWDDPTLLCGVFMTNDLHSFCENHCFGMQVLLLELITWAEKERRLPQPLCSNLFLEQFMVPYMAGYMVPYILPYMVSYKILKTDYNTEGGTR